MNRRDFAKAALAPALWRIGATAAAEGLAAPRQVLAFYYGWYGNPETSHRWVHWKNVDPTAHHIDESAHFPVLGAYDSHDPTVVDTHCRQARDAGLTGFIVSWWAKGDFHDQGMP